MRTHACERGKKIEGYEWSGQAEKRSEGRQTYDVILRFAEIPGFQILERISLQANIYLTPIPLSTVLVPRNHGPSAISISLLPHPPPRSMAARLFDISRERAFDGDWRNAIQSKATHRVRTDVVVPINGLEAILFPTCVRTRPFRSWSIAAKIKVSDRVACIRENQSRF